MRRSTIDPAWQGLIQRLLRHPGLSIAIATDHYAEATDQILGQLRALDVEAALALGAGAERVWVANSADLGHHKASRAFWIRLKAARALEGLARVVLVDDFGVHEEELDAYAQQDKIGRRREETVQVLGAVFSAPVHVFPFVLTELSAGREDKEKLVRRYRALIQQAGQFVADALSPGTPLG